MIWSSKGGAVDNHGPPESGETKTNNIRRIARRERYEAGNFLFGAPAAMAARIESPTGLWSSIFGGEEQLKPRFDV
jgi:hypothetical protein